MKLYLLAGSMALVLLIGGCSEKDPPKARTPEQEAYRVCLFNAFQADATFAQATQVCRSLKPKVPY